MNDDERLPPRNFRISLPALTTAKAEAMDSRRARPFPSAIDICPSLRPRARYAATNVRRLVATLLAAFPDSAFLVRDPGAAERINTTPYDHIAADVIAAARTLCDAIAVLDDPP
jgi:hypothetical protein